MSIEYNRGWYKKISDLVKQDKNIIIKLFESKNPYNEEMNDYVNYPSKLGKKYDLILVDGRKRLRCLIQAKTLLNPRGIVILHDAHRKYYQSAFKEYIDSHLIFFKENKKALWYGKKPIFK